MEMLGSEEQKIHKTSKRNQTSKTNLDDFEELFGTVHASDRQSVQELNYAESVKI